MITQNWWECPKRYRGALPKTNVNVLGDLKGGAYGKRIT